MGVNRELQDLKVEDILYRAVRFYLRIGSHEQAEKLLYLQLQEEKTKYSALDKLVLIHIKNGNFLRARDLLENYAQENKGSLSYGLLENVEENYETSKSYYSLCYGSKVEDKAKLAIARLEMQLGNYKEAEELLEELRASGKYLEQLPFDFTFLEILKKQYEEAFLRFQEINLDLYGSNMIRTYRQLEIYLKSILGKFDVSTISLRSLNDYLLFRYLTDEDKVLFKHISYHIAKDTSNGFLRELKLVDLLEEATNKIQTLNPSHFNMTDKYKFRMDKPVGYKDGELTNDICVETILGTDKILTMYPCLFSDAFGREGNGTSEELKRKREMERKI